MISTAIKTWLAPYEVYLWAAGAVLLLVLGLKINSDLKDHYQAQLLAADAKATALQVKLNAKVEADAQNSLNPANSQLHIALDASPSVAAFTLRVCPDAPTFNGSSVSADGSAGPGSGGTTGPVRSPVASVPTSVGIDIRPTTEQLLAKADAEIAYWHKYYADCKTNKICK